MPPDAVSPLRPPSGSTGQDSADSFLRDAAAVSDPSMGEAAPPARLVEGDVLAERFVIERLAGSGGMGFVYRALDRMTGTHVAVKVMALHRDEARFAQEARVLSELTHPAVVQYVAHGTTRDGGAFLAMEWLHGEDLAHRLARSGLDVAESLAVARRVAEGLAVAHARGVVHRDVKPSNVFLVGGDPARAKLLDFGIVRLQLEGRAPSLPPVTRTGIILGTVGYMSPEQATADRAIDARTDVFALGCVLFECLTGRPAFSGAHVVAVLAKVLREEAPRVRDLRPALPAKLDDLVARMLSKDRAGRQADGRALLAELEALGSVEGGLPEAGVRPAAGLSSGEQRLVSVMLAVVPDEPQVAEIVGRHGGDPARLADGVLLVTLGGRGSTSEQVVKAAACALDLSNAFPSARIALAMGRAQTTAGGPPGLVIDQAAALLAPSARPGIRIDEVTAGLLGERFEVVVEGKGHVLAGRRSDGEPPRTLLGKPTPFVGRDKELGLLEGTLKECIEESVALAVLVTAPAGQGKSRLRHEFLNRARERGDVRILAARSDPVGAGSAFLMVRQLVSHAAGLREVDPASERSRMLRSYVAHLCNGLDSARIADFLGELVGVPSTERPSPELRAGRSDPQLMATWLARSFGEWLAAECSARPLLVVLEDLHWGDLPSVSYLGENLQALAAKPFMVLALARPEVHDTFPNLWSGIEKNEISLGRLSPRAGERLVRAALGGTVAEEAVARIVQRADGNAFYLEELIRRVADREGDTLPQTVLALAQSRLERLEPEARRIVRAASVFGEVFWRGGVAALRGEPGDGGDLNDWLRTLTQREVVSPASSCRFPEEREYVFRHGLLRDAAYAMLTEDDRTIGHRLAGDWLARVGEKDALTMADHFEKGGEHKRAVPWLLEAAQRAFDGANVDAALKLGRRGIDCGAEGIERGHLRHVQGTAFFITGDIRASVEMSREAMGLLGAGSTAWFATAASSFVSGMFLGDASVTVPVLQAILDVRSQPEPSGPYGHAVYCTSLGLAGVGQFELACSFLKRAEAIGEADSDPDPLFVLHIRNSRGVLDYMQGEFGSALASLSEARVLGDRAGEAFGQARTRLIVGQTLGQIGHHDRTEAAIHELLSFCEPRGIGAIADWGVATLALARLVAHRAGEAIDGFSTLLGRTDRFLATMCRALLAQALVHEGDLVAAIGEAETSLEDGAPFPKTQALAFGALAQIELRRQRPAEALAFAERGLEAENRSPLPWSGSIVHLCRAEALDALGRTDDARTAIRAGRERIHRIAATLDGHPDLREAYLTALDVNVRTLRLASEWLIPLA